MYCHVQMGAAACLGAAGAGLIAGVFRGFQQLLLYLLAVSIVVGGFKLFQLWKGSRELARR